MRDLERGGQLANRYSLVRRLGGGRITQTWLATDRMTRASVALKILTDDRVDAGLLRREWQTSIRLVHAHIVRVFEFHEDDDGAFYSLQYIDGADIGVVSGASPQEILAPIVLVAEALAYAHGKGVVHRDIKAGNVLLDANGAPYLIDFGVAATQDGDIGGGSLIAASPQTLAGEPATAADDVFALGGLVYELLSGASPYSSEATAGDIRERIPPPVTAADGSVVDPRIRELVAGMLAKERDARPSAAQVAETLRQAGIAGGPAPADRVGRARQLEDEIVAADAAIRRRRDVQAAAAEPARTAGDGLNPRIVIGGLAVLLVLLLGVVFLLPRTVDDSGVAETPADGEATDVPAATTEQAADEPLPARDERVQARQSAEEVLGRLLARTRTLEGRAVQRWGGLAWKRAEDAYAAGDAAYLERDYAQAEVHYRDALDALEPLLDDVDRVFRRTLADAESALNSGDAIEAVRLYELAVAISPSHAPALAGLRRARNLDAVLALTEQGLEHERNLELNAAVQSFERAIEIDPEWQVAVDGLERVRGTINQMQFDARMTEGLTALAEGDYRAARAAFRRAQEIQPGSSEPADGLLQVEQEIRLDNIAALEREAAALESAERWQAAVETYDRILELDPDLAFAKEGRARSSRMQALHAQLDTWITDPDSLSAPRTMQAATSLLVDITRMPDIGPRLASQRDELSRLLKRAATPLTVELVSDNVTDVSIYKVGKLGSFERTELALRPGTYVAVGSRPGYRDVRLEFRVAPEIDMQPVIVRCEERI